MITSVYDLLPNAGLSSMSPQKQIYNYFESKYNKPPFKKQIIKVICQLYANYLGLNMWEKSEILYGLPFNNAYMFYGVLKVANRS